MSDGDQDLRGLDELALSEHLMPVFLDELSDGDLLPLFDGLRNFSDVETPAPVPSRTDASPAPQLAPDVAPRFSFLSTGSPLPSAADGRVEEEKRRPPMQNSTRKRQKAELAYLRDKVVRLERDLAARRCAFMTSNSGDSRGGEYGKESRTIAVKPRRHRRRGDRKLLWECIAKQQLVEKQRAEMQNFKLRESLGEQLKLARSLQRLLKKPLAHAEDAADAAALEGRSEFGDCSNNRLSRRGVSEPELYDALMRDMDHVYAEVDAVCARHCSMRGLDDDGYDAEPAPFRAADTETDSGPEPLFLEATTSKVIPFSMEETCAAVWRCLSNNHVKLADGSYHGVACSPDTIRAKSVMTLRVGNVRAQMRMRFAMKKFVERDRVVLTCESASDIEGPRDLLHGLKMMERGWVVIRPVPAGYYSDDDDIRDEAKSQQQHQETIIQLCMRLTPSLSVGMLESSGQRAGALTELILTAVHRNLGWLFQNVENILMEQAIASTSS